jgi:HEAT repeat protein
VEPLIALLADKDVIIRYGAVKALGAIGDSRAFNPLAQLLLDPSEMVKRLAKKSISKVLPAESARKAGLQPGHVIKLIAILKTEDGTLKEVDIDL